MRSARRAVEPVYPKSWEVIPTGDSIRDALQKQCNEMSARMFGYHLVKLGALSADISLSQCSIRHQVALTNFAANSNVQTLSYKLPLQGNSVDAFLVTLELDFAHDPHQILREVDRSITANGMVLLCGFNPWSYSGLIRYSPLYWKNPLKQARFFTCARIKDWLQLLHYEVVDERFVLHQSVFSDWRIPYTHKAREKIATFLPRTGSAYCILAKKCTIPMSVAKSKWRASRPRFIPVQAGTQATSPASQVARHREAQE